MYSLYSHVNNLINKTVELCTVKRLYSFLSLISTQIVFVKHTCKCL